MKKFIYTVLFILSITLFSICLLASVIIYATVPLPKDIPLTQFNIQMYNVFHYWYFSVGCFAGLIGTFYFKDEI